MPYFDLLDDAGHADSDDTLGGRLTLARDAAGMTLEMVAHRMGIHAATLHYWEADRAAPDLIPLRKLAAILGVSPMWLLTGMGEGPDSVADVLPLVSRRFNRKILRKPKLAR